MFFLTCSSSLQAQQTKTSTMSVIDGKLYPVEVKSKSSLPGHGTSGLRAFRQTYGPGQSRSGAGHLCRKGVFPS